MAFMDPIMDDVDVITSVFRTILDEPYDRFYAKIMIQDSDSGQLIYSFTKHDSNCAIKERLQNCIENLKSRLFHVVTSAVFFIDLQKVLYSDVRNMLHYERLRNIMDDAAISLGTKCTKLFKLGQVDDIVVMGSLELTKGRYEYYDID